MKDPHPGMETMLGLLATPILHGIAYVSVTRFEEDAYGIILYTIGYWQVIYMIPLIIILALFRRRHFASGLAIGMGLSVLLNTAVCGMA